MKKINYGVLFCLLFSIQLFAQNDNCVSAPIQQVPIQSKGRWLPSEGTLNVLIVFAEFPDDNYDVNNVRWVKGNAPQNMNSWIDQTWSTNPTQGSLTHYFNEMSGNKLHFIGKVVHAVAPHTRSWYITNHLRSGRGYATQDIIQQLDATWDFAEFDNWQRISDYTYNNVPDTYLDMVIFVWRNAVADRSSAADSLDFVYNEADLGFIGDIGVDGGLRKLNTYSLGSGVTIKNYLNQDPFRTVVHEFSHYLLGGNEMHNGFGFWGMLSAWGIRSYVANSFERYRLGWVADSTSYTVNNTTQTLTSRTLSNFVSGGNAYRLVINTSPQEYFFIENHQKTSYWENNQPFWGSQDGTVENGIYVIRYVGTPTQSNPSWLQLIAADGRFDWVVNQSVNNPWGSGQLPVFKQLTPDIMSGYHDDQFVPFSYGGLASPQPIHYTEQLGYPVQDIRFHGDGKDAFRIDYNQVFSPWSNPNNQRVANQTTPFGFEITSFSNGVFTLNIYVNTSVDASPAKPQNLHFTGADPYHPSLAWDLNTEPDISSYNVYRSYDNSVYWDLAGTTSHPTNTFIDYAVDYTKPIWAKSVKYYVKAVDNTSKLSVPSEQVETTGTMGPRPAMNADNFAITKVADEGIDNLGLLTNYPNPFNPSTKISFTIPQKSQIKLKISDVLGREVSILADGVYEAGKYEIEFNANNLPSGVYFYNLTAGSNSITKKMLFLK